MTRQTAGTLTGTLGILLMFSSLVTGVIILTGNQAPLELFAACPLGFLIAFSGWIIKNG